MIFSFHFSLDRLRHWHHVFIRCPKELYNRWTIRLSYCAISSLQTTWNSTDNLITVATTFSSIPNFAYRYQGIALYLLQPRLGYIQNELYQKRLNRNHLGCQRKFLRTWILGIFTDVQVTWTETRSAELSWVVAIMANQVTCSNTHYFSRYQIFLNGEVRC